MVYTSEPGNTTSTLPLRGPSDLLASAMQALDRSIKVIISEVCARVDSNFPTMFTTIEGDIPSDISASQRRSSRPQDILLTGGLQDMNAGGPTAFATKSEMPGDKLTSSIQEIINTLIRDTSRK